MKHISELLTIRKRELEDRKQLGLFTASTEKGSSEWSAFNAVAGDSAGMFGRSAPERPRYSNVVPIRRFREPYIFVPKRA